MMSIPNKRSKVNTQIDQFAINFDAKSLSPALQDMFAVEFHFRTLDSLTESQQRKLDDCGHGRLTEHPILGATYIPFECGLIGLCQRCTEKAARILRSQLGYALSQGSTYVTRLSHKDGTKLMRKLGKDSVRRIPVSDDEDVIFNTAGEGELLTETPPLWVFADLIKAKPVGKRTSGRLGHEATDEDPNEGAIIEVPATRINCLKKEWAGFLKEAALSLSLDNYDFKADALLAITRYFNDKHFAACELAAAEGFTVKGTAYLKFRCDLTRVEERIHGLNDIELPEYSFETMELVTPEVEYLFKDGEIVY